MVQRDGRVADDAVRHVHGLQPTSPPTTIVTSRASSFSFSVTHSPAPVFEPLRQCAIVRRRYFSLMRA